MTNPIAPLQGLPHTIQDEETEGEGQVLAVPTAYRNHQFTIIGNGAVSDGVIQIEAAPTWDYAGTWAPVTTPVDVPNASAEIVTISGIYNFLRARISTAVVGGTVTIQYTGNL